METKFDPKAVEAKWYADWKSAGYFKPEAQEGNGRPYTITIPPPNVTGSLHMGHAVCYTIQDALGRWRRMQGRQVLILPGVDHAGIATQNVVEKEIAREGLTRHDLGREKFLERVWAWKQQYGARIISQMQGLGCAFDWERERFTMDETYVDAILEEFVRMFDSGMIYRGARVINWCPRCATALSDIEVEYVERDSHLWHIRYDFVDGNGSVTVATTRPETMLGDTAVAVNPADPRYAGMEGRMLILPLTGRHIPLIYDDYASLEFGTGAVKVTPAHDLNDYEAGKRHGLPMTVVIGETGRMTAEAGDKYAGLTREEAREAVVEDLTAQGYLVNIEDYRHSVGTCERCHTIIEPLLSEQWFARMAGTKMIEKCVAAIEDDSVKFIPDRYKRISLDWLENIRDWCISRQLWWGHRIPIFYAHDGRFTAAKTIADAAVKLGVPVDTLRQDEDVLDTWFSSALWPFATLGWPGDTDDLRRFYPTNVLTTAREILFLWVARMIMTGVEFTGKAPFDDVYIYATVLDKQGRRMSKSLGNGIDPLEMIDKYGADALRFSLMRLASKGQDIRFSEDRIPESRNFCTKIWNAARFALMNEAAVTGDDSPENLADAPLHVRWIYSRLQRTARTVGESLETYDLDEACRAITEFFWNDYCDWFVELSKPALRSDDLEEKARARRALIDVLDSSLRLLHPFMPFLTEEIFRSIGHETSIMFAPYPVADDALIDDEAERQMHLLITAIRAVRNARAELSIAPSLPLDATLVSEDDSGWVLKDNALAFETLAKVRSLVLAPKAPADKKSIALPIAPGLDLYLPLEGVIDFDKERARIETELAGVEKDLRVVGGKLANPRFVANAAPDIVAKDRERYAELTEKEAKLKERRAALGG
ncbi:MAG: valine--tRNA ligase [Capsulimonadaceae bacterium]|nr:valine--tRNA ligase [Capsulimonadaceae bacterium]